MKVMFLVLLITVITINSAPFLRRLETSKTTITKDSCEKLGKDYSEGKSASCIKNDNMYNVTDESECEAGSWGAKCSANAASVLTQAQCKGTPVFSTTTTVKTQSSCKVKDTGEVAESGKDEDSCKEKVKWTADSKCSVEKVTNLDDCKGSGTWSIGTCKITGTEVSLGEMSQDACGKIKVGWDDTASVNKCKVTAFTCPSEDSPFSTSGSDCLISDTVIVADDKDTKCKSTTFEGKTKANDGKCYVAGNVEVEAEDVAACNKITLSKKGSCSISTITEEGKCKYTFTNTVYENKCTLTLTADGGSTTTIELTDEERLTDKEKCQTQLQWDEACNGAVGNNKTDCIVKGEYTRPTAAVCVEKSDDSSGNKTTTTNKTTTDTSKSSGTTLAFKFTFILIISLLF